MSEGFIYSYFLDAVKGGREKPTIQEMSTVHSVPHFQATASKPALEKAVRCSGVQVSSFRIWDLYYISLWQFLLFTVLESGMYTGMGLESTFSLFELGDGTVRV